MTTPDRPNVNVSVGDAATLARQAGLRMQEDQQARFAADLAAARQLVADLELVDMQDVPPVTGSFDPSWPSVTGARR